MKYFLTKFCIVQINFIKRIVFLMQCDDAIQTLYKEQNCSVLYSRNPYQLITMHDSRLCAGTYNL